MKKYQITFLPDDRSIEIEEGTTDEKTIETPDETKLDEENTDDKVIKPDSGGDNPETEIKFETSIIDAITPEKKDSESENNNPNSKERFPQALHILPLTNRPFFPHQVIPLILDANPWLETVNEISESSHKMFGLVAVETEDMNEAQSENFYEMGTICKIHRVIQSDDKLQIVVEGLQRFTIEGWLSKVRPFLVKPRYYPETRPDNTEDVEILKPYVLAVINTIKELLPLNPLYNEELKVFVQRFSPEEPSPLADFAASLTMANKPELQEILETLPILPRLEKVLLLLNKELEQGSAILLCDLD